MTTARIAGWGAVTPAGVGVDALWGAAVEGRTFAFRRDVHPGGEDPMPVVVAASPALEDHFERHELRRLDRLHQLGLVATRQAIEDAPPSEVPSERTGVVVGVGFCALGYLETQHELAITRPHRVNPLAIPLTMTNSLAAHVALLIGARGPVHTVATACASGSDAIGHALGWLRLGSVDRVVVVGADAMLTRGALTFFSRMGALSDRIDEPASASRPFSETRDGFVAADGAAALVLERVDAGVEQGRGSILGYGASCDGVHIAAPDPTGAGMRRSMGSALADAGVGADAIVSISAHGTSTPLNDEIELAAIGEVVSDVVPVTSLKGTTGHMIGASGVAEAICAVLTSRTGCTPPTASTTEPIGVQVVTAEAVRHGPGPVLTNSFGFGGQNSSLVVEAP